MAGSSIELGGLVDGADAAKQTITVIMSIILAYEFQHLDMTSRRSEMRV